MNHPDSADRSVLAALGRLRAGFLDGAAREAAPGEDPRLATWDNEGGAPLPAPRARTLPNAPTLPDPRPLTALDCRRRAGDDLAAAAQSPTAESRRALQRSAAAWTLRADVLQRLAARRRDRAAKWRRR